MIYDLAIIGGGPAGTAAGVYAARKQLKTLFITKNWNGQSAVSEAIYNWIGTEKISGVELAENLKKHLETVANNFVEIKDNSTVTKIAKRDGVFSISTTNDNYECKTILIASGSHRRKLDIPGADRLEHKGLTYCASCDGPLFEGQDVVVIGGGNAAFDSAAQLLAYCKSVTLLNRSSNFRADPSTISAVSQNKHFKIIKNAIPKEILGDKFVKGIIYHDNESNTDITLSVEAIFVEIGSLPNTDFVKDLVKTNEYGHIIVDPRNERTSETGIWAAGDCTDGLYHQNNIAAGDAVKAIEDIYLFLKTRS